MLLCTHEQPNLTIRSSTERRSGGVASRDIGRGGAAVGGVRAAGVDRAPGGRRAGHSLSGERAGGSQLLRRDVRAGDTGFRALPGIFGRWRREFGDAGRCGAGGDGCRRLDRGRPQGRGRSLVGRRPRGGEPGARRALHPRGSPGPLPHAVLGGVGALPGRARVRRRMMKVHEAYGMLAELTAGGLVPLRGRRRVLTAVGALVFLAALVVWTKAAERPPSPVPASAPETKFSAERAWRHLERIADEEPTPIGGAGGDEVRDYLVDELTALGLDVEVQDGVGVRTFDADTVAGRVENVVATLPGRDSTGRVFLAAHYDTTFGAPGASDDKAAVAAILETARALRSGERLRNDVVLLLTDGEEPGLLGAESFVEQHPYGAEGGVVLNWEATGNSGPSVLFETSAANAALIEEFAKSAPYPVGEAAMAELYEESSQNTDFTVFKEEGFTGLNFAFIEGGAYYHNPRDTTENFDPASMQHHGANMLALARAFGERDLATLDSDTNATYFTLFGAVIGYPAWLMWPLSSFAVVALAALSLVAHRRKLVTVPRLVAGIGAGLVPLVLAPLAAIGLWEGLLILPPSYAGMRDPYQPELYRWALAALTAVIVLGWYALLRRRTGAAAMAIGALAWPAALGVVTAWLAPGLSYYGPPPAPAASCGWLAALAIPERLAAWRVVALTAGAAAGVIILIVGASAILAVVGIPMGAAAVFFFALAGSLALPLVELTMPQDPTGAPDPTHRRPTVRRWAIMLALTIMLLAGLSGAGLVVDRFDEDRPAPTHLMYVLDADTATALWASEDDAPHEWTAGGGAAGGSRAYRAGLPHRRRGDRPGAAADLAAGRRRAHPARRPSCTERDHHRQRPSARHLEPRVPRGRWGRAVALRVALLRSTDRGSLGDSAVS